MGSEGSNPSVSATSRPLRSASFRVFPRLFGIGAHFFLGLTIFIAIYDEDYVANSGPLSFQREYAEKLSHWLGKDYPTVAL